MRTANPETSAESTVSVYEIAGALTVNRESMASVQWRIGVCAAAIVGIARQSVVIPSERSESRNLEPS
jgi:hypothetical protein